jgi:hypothetical protein
VRAAAVPAVALVLLATACAGGTDDTEADVPRWDGPPQPLPADGAVPVDAFDEYALAVDKAWERSPEDVASTFTAAARRDGVLTIGVGAGGPDTPVTVQLDDLADDSIRTVRYELVLEPRDDGTWRIESAAWSQRCRAGRGHQGFSPEPCL